jgi:hypothetical protein
MKIIDFNFVILSPEANYGLIKSTVRSIRGRYKDVAYCCVVGGRTSPKRMQEIKKICPDLYKGKGTITSLINQGVKKGDSCWKYIIFEGVTMSPNRDKKYKSFIESEKNILYPIITDYDRQGNPLKCYTDFDEATLNGLFIHQKTLKEVGDFTDNPLNISKLFWMLEAADKGCTFKAILGAKVF